MDLFDALGEEFGREFADRKDTLPRDYFYEPEAAARLAASLSGEIRGRRALAFSDARTRQAGGAVLEALSGAGFHVDELPIRDGADGSSPVCDEGTKDALLGKLPRADVLVAIGSGVVNDLTKWLGAERNIPYAVFATAASMNGYTAANVAPTVKGVKTLFRASAPRVVAADPRVIEGAPWELTASGLGDVVAKPVSTADWILNHRLFAEDYSPAVARIINRIEPKYLENPQGLAGRKSEAVQSLFEALVWSGCAMTLQGSSLPASGGEHLVSHTLDMLAHVDGQKHDLHGRQVGVATIFVAALFEKLLAVPRPRFTPVEVPFDAKLWGPIAGAVAVQHKKKMARMREACRLLSAPDVWEEAKAEIASVLLTPERIKSCLKDAKAAHRLADIGCSRERFLVAVRHCAAIRGRFTSIDLAWAAGLLPDAAEEIVDRWLV